MRWHLACRLLVTLSALSQGMAFSFTPTGQLVSSVSGPRSCDRFQHIPNQMSFIGDQLRMVGHGYSPEQCQQACLGSTYFTCSAVQIHKPSLCFIMGFTLRTDVQSTHFYRTCSSGPQCFRATRHKIADFTTSVLIPNDFTDSPEMASLYCIASCDERPSCVAFNLRQDKWQTRTWWCMFQEADVLNDTSFDSYVRRC